MRTETPATQLPTTRPPPRPRPLLLPLLLLMLPTFAAAGDSGLFGGDWAALEASTLAGLRDANDSVVALTDVTFDNVVRDGAVRIAFVEFYAPWCPHCQKVSWGVAAAERKPKAQCKQPPTHVLRPYAVGAGDRAAVRRRRCARP
mmetsp:Transcript_946/g.2599  ORF Transcript_946/g.2599 Transcript_946/m.2599 type:complete len:145 (-) Transcript_946:2711-3145(-)